MYKLVIPENIHTITTQEMDNTIPFLLTSKNSSALPLSRF